MRDETYQIIGLVGFILAGLLFVAVGYRAGDILTIIASVIWTLSCIIWIIPLVRQPKD